MDIESMLIGGIITLIAVGCITLLVVVFRDAYGSSKINNREILECIVRYFRLKFRQEDRYGVDGWKAYRDGLSDTENDIRILTNRIDALYNHLKLEHITKPQENKAVPKKREGSKRE